MKQLRGVATAGDTGGTRPPRAPFLASPGRLRPLQARLATQWRQREFKVGGDEPCEPTVRLPD